MATVLCQLGDYDPGTLNMRIESIDGADTWNGTNMVPKTDLDDADFGTLGVIACVARVNADDTKDGDWAATWPSLLTTEADYRVKFYPGTPVVAADVAVGEGHWTGTDFQDIGGGSSGGGGPSAFPDIDGLDFAEAMKLILSAVSGTASRVDNTVHFKDRAGAVVLSITYGTVSGERTSSLLP